MAERGAQQGNKNAAKGKEWTEALRQAIAKYEDKNIERGGALLAIATTVVSKAIAGDKDAWKEIGERYDGKPVQAIAGDLDLNLTVEIVKFANQAA